VICLECGGNGCVKGKSSNVCAECKGQGREGADNPDGTTAYSTGHHLLPMQRRR
jgi:DnaJ-class molecular chaperone